ncbi:2-oxoglutarate dehydrogenase E1 component [Pseudolycoriella hygida]|uniref:2-oxoglutarate dehydrogenase, mitochondrial n=1 Tax=Pseudolycoriella hygida TaxID=35572 RepID=A0A9Q0S4U7_9DIPT|nr:2-oxoglutarate dehydrogenase E1 component [Pseudolycoriella hygida]
MNKNLKQNSFLFGSNAVFIEELYQLYLTNKNAVDESWQNYFQTIKDSDHTQVSRSTARIITEFNQSKQDISLDNTSLLKLAQLKGSAGDTEPQVAAYLSMREDSATYQARTSPAKVEFRKGFKEYESSVTVNKLRVKAMIAAYREYSHYLVPLDPLRLQLPKTKEELGLNKENFGFTNDQLSSIIEIDNEFFAVESCTLQELINSLDQAYAKNIAIEFNHVKNKEEKSWLCKQLENNSLESNNLKSNNFTISQHKKKILQDLVEVEGFEQYLHVKFPGAKRFSVEGGEAAVIAIDQAIDLSMQQGVGDVVLGMSHRGRISTLAKIMSKPYHAIMAGFITGSFCSNDLDIAGDVKYHMGYSSERVRGEMKAYLSLASNPSHLEAINPVVAGKVRGKQDEINDLQRKKVLGILVHGDSAFCGQGVVAESLAMAELTAYTVGGIIHLVINNQLGFTANNSETTVSRYSTEFAKIIDIPILHVNGDDIEAVLKATNIAVNYRHKFAKDIVVEIVCYRKYGHNEGDEPMYTQGPMYNVIKNKPSPATVYADSLLLEGVIDENYLATLKSQFKLKLDKEYEEAKNYRPKLQCLEKLWVGYKREDNGPVITGVNKNVLKEFGIKLCEVPEGFPVHPKLTKLFAARKNTLIQDQPIDWATAEQLAFASLLSVGNNIRFTGQDSVRGTFSHRHAILHSQIDRATYTPLNNISSGQGHFDIANSNLSEYAVLGFEFGYSLINPRNLVIWEAQFGDFANGAQIIFDQFISSCEDKWLRMSGIVVLLPHGYEGQGSEHSSARLERFLQLAAKNNIKVTYPTTPASFFHLLRRQICSTTRRPLIVMSPKSLLRHKMVVSDLAELDENTSFLPILDEINHKLNPLEIKRVIFCTGKVYYDLLEARNNKNIRNIVIIRVEQLYPFAQDMVIKILTKYNKAKEFIWCQEEPNNMGAWSFIRELLDNCLKEALINDRIRYIGRESSAAPSTNIPDIHSKQQQQLLEEAIVK